MKIAVFMGGISSEREISLKTGNAILNALCNMGYDAHGVVLDEKNMITELTKTDYDLAYIALHGEFGEDGRVQALLDIVKKPYTGSGFISSALAMDKEFTKRILESKSIRVPKTYENISEIDSFPVVIKPSLEGSSVGVNICMNMEEARNAADVLKDKKLSIEEFVKGEELTVGVLNGEPLGVVQIKPKSGVYDYKSKYTKGETEYIAPAEIPNDVYDRAMEIAGRIFGIMELNGGARIDMIFDGCELYVLEANTIPGMTETSLLPKAAALKGYDFNRLVKKIVEAPYKKFAN